MVTRQLKHTNWPPLDMVAWVATDTLQPNSYVARAWASDENRVRAAREALSHGNTGTWRVPRQ